MKNLTPQLILDIRSLESKRRRAKELIEFFWPLRKFQGERAVIKDNIKTLKRLRG